MLRQHQRRLLIRTMGRGLVDVTEAVLEELRAIQIDEGLVTLFIRHTSASLVIQENADSNVQDDLERFFARLVRDGDPLFLHRSEGPDDMPAHVRASLTATQISVPVSGGELVLGTWQGIYLWEHRTRAHQREIVVHILGE
ncbi:MAG: YjbQ family protein [Oxalobacteraceae bacterium]|nr:MAG: YjbQ family protein [Oxalobacteraceae bacterium]